MPSSLTPSGDDESGATTTAGRPWVFLLSWAIALVVLGALVRAPGLGRSLWLDELTTAWVCGTDEGTLLERAWLNNLSPLYYTIVNASIVLWGYTEVGLRMPSFLAGLAVIPAALLFAHHYLRSRTVAVVLSLIVTFDPVFVRYAFEARPYSMIMLLSLFQVHMWLSLYTKPSFVRGAVCGIAMAILTYLHYTTLLLAGAEWLFLACALVTPSKTLRPRLTALIFPFLVAAVLCLPMVPHILYLANSKDTLSFAPDRPVLDVITKFGLHHYVLYTVVVGIVVDQLLRKTWRHTTGTGSILPPAILFAFSIFWFAIPVGTLRLLHETDIARIDVDRYVIASALAPIMGLGAIVMLCRSRITRVVCLALGCVGCAVAIYHATSGFSDPGRPYSTINDWRSSVTYLAEAAADDTPIFVWAGLTETNWLDVDSRPILESYLLCPVNSLYRLNGPEFDGRVMPMAFGDSELIHRRQVAMLSRKGGAWLLVMEQARRREGLLNALQSQLDASGVSATVESEQFAGVVVVHIVVR